VPALPPTPPPLPAVEGGRGRLPTPPQQPAPAPAPSKLAVADEYISPATVIASPADMTSSADMPRHAVLSQPPVASPPPLAVLKEAPPPAVPKLDVPLAASQPVRVASPRASRDESKPEGRAPQSSPLAAGDSARALHPRPVQPPAPYEGVEWEMVPQRWEFAAPVDPRAVRARRQGLLPGPAWSAGTEGAHMTASLPYDDVYNKAAAPAFESPRAIQQRINEGREEDGSRKLGFRRKGFYSPAGPAFNPSPIAWMTDKDFPWEGSRFQRRPGGRNTPSPPPTSSASPHEAERTSPPVSPPPNGLKWIRMGKLRPQLGIPLVNRKLSEALTHGTAFSDEEWGAFGVKERLTVDHFIKSGDAYFKPSVISSATIPAGHWGVYGYAAGQQAPATGLGLGLGFGVSELGAAGLGYPPQLPPISMGQNFWGSAHGNAASGPTTVRRTEHSSVTTSAIGAGGGAGGSLGTGKVVSLPKHGMLGLTLTSPPSTPNCHKAWASNEPAVEKHPVARNPGGWAGSTANPPKMGRDARAYSTPGRVPK